MTIDTTNEAERKHLLEVGTEALKQSARLADALAH